MKTDCFWLLSTASTIEQLKCKSHGWQKEKNMARLSHLGVSPERVQDSHKAFRRGEVQQIMVSQFHLCLRGKPESVNQVSRGVRLLVKAVLNCVIVQLEKTGNGEG